MSNEQSQAEEQITEVPNLNIDTNVEPLVKDMTREQVTQNMEKHAPEDIAAAFFGMEQPNLKRLIDGLSHRQLKRLVFQLVSHPFTPAQYVPTSEEEKKAFYLGNEMIQNRMIMQLSMEMQKVHEAEQKQLNNDDASQGVSNETKTDSI